MIASMQEIYQADMKQGYGGYDKDVIDPYFSVARNSPRFSLSCALLPCPICNTYIEILMAVSIRKWLSEMLLRLLNMNSEMVRHFCMAKPYQKMSRNY